MVALYDYAAQGPEDLEFSEGDTIDILGEGIDYVSHSFWASVDTFDTQGNFLSNFAELCLDMFPLIF